MRRRQSSDVMDDDGTTEREASAGFGRSASKVTIDEVPESNSRKKKFISRFYAGHLVLVASVVLLGMMHNVGNKKYIPVNAKELVKLMRTQRRSSNVDPDDDWKHQCKKAYVNVHSSSGSEQFAAICCHDNENDTTMHMYYHTQGEIIVGYLVSLFVQLPICYLMCSEEWARLRRIIGVGEASVVDEKSD
eukprot:scaffold743_cov145-Skeletonema_menzelii.AAC.10